MERREFLMAAAAMAAAAPLGAAPAPAGIALPGAINRAGRQRMLSQRSAKAWLMSVLGVLPDRARSILDQTVTRFDQQLADLKTQLPSDEVRILLAQLESEWSRYRPLLGDIRSDPKAVWEGNEAVLAAAQKLTVAYEKALGNPAGHQVALAGRQRMLSQRMAKAYFFRQMNVNPGPAAAMLEQATQEFAKAQAELKAAPGNSPQLNTELGLVEQQWFFFQNALALREGVDPKRAAADVATTSERILEQMDLVVGLYEKLAVR